MRKFPPVEVDLGEKVAVVTGASSGIGKEIARNLARMRATVVLACRDKEKGEAAREEIVGDTGNKSVELELVDVSSQASIRSFTKSLLARHSKLNILVNNAGVALLKRQISVDGIELMWATNVVGYYLVTKLLQSALQAGAPSRIVNVASTFVLAPDLEDPEFKIRSYSLASAYRQSKAADRMLTWAFARRLRGSGVTANAIHPGGVNTGIYRDPKGVIGWLIRAYIRLFKLTPAEGADTATWAAADPSLAGVTNKFFAYRKELSCEFRDETREERLWEICERMTAQT